MKNVFSLLASLCLLSAATDTIAQGITVPNSQSPKASVSQTVGISTIAVTYSRPSVRGREVWGQLVPYGWNAQSFGSGVSAPWRAGANENTILTLSHDSKIQGKSVPAGSYGLFFTINADNTGEVILSKDTRSWGSFWYVAAHDQMRAPIKINDNAFTEALTFDFLRSDKTSTKLVLNWEKKQFPIKIEFDTDNIVMANATEQLKGTVGFNWQGYASAANYALNNKVNGEQAMKWIDQAIATNKNFQTLQIKAGLVRNAGNTAEADKIMKEALPLSTEVELNAYGYQLLGANQFDKAIEVLAMNTTRFPSSANAWDSLGEAYALKGDKANAIKNFKKVLTMNPTAPIRANSEKYLKQLGAM